MTLKKLYKKAVKTLEFQRLLAFCCQTRDYNIDAVLKEYYHKKNIADIEEKAH